MVGGMDKNGEMNGQTSTIRETNLTSSFLERNRFVT